MDIIARNKMPISFLRWDVKTLIFANDKSIRKLIQTFCLLKEIII